MRPLLFLQRNAFGSGPKSVREISASIHREEGARVNEAKWGQCSRESWPAYIIDLLICSAHRRKPENGHGNCILPSNHVASKFKFCEFQAIFFFIAKARVSERGNDLFFLALVAHVITRAHFNVNVAMYVVHSHTHIRSLVIFCKLTDNFCTFVSIIHIHTYIHRYTHTLTATVHVYVTQTTPKKLFCTR